MDDDLMSAFDEPERRGPNAPPAPGKRRRGRPTKAEAAAHAAEKAAELAEKEPDPFVDGLAAGELPDATAFHRPVTRTFLATILGIEPRRLVKRLAKCPVVEWQTYKGDRIPLYDFKVAIAYCVEPKIDLAKWLETQNPMTLPISVNKAAWEGLRARQLVMRDAGQLWHTNDVLAVLGETALVIKDTARLWLEGLPGREKLTTEQHEHLRSEVSGLLDEVHARLVEAPSKKATGSLADSYDGMVADATPGIEED